MKSKSPTRRFVSVRMALKGGKSKADYIEACKEKGIRVVYSGKEIVDEEGKVTRGRGFYLS